MRTATSNMGKPRAIKGQGSSELEVDSPAGEGMRLPEALQLHLDKVLEAITASKEALEQKIESVVIDVNLLRADQAKIARKSVV